MVGASHMNAHAYNSRMLVRRSCHLMAGAVHGRKHAVRRTLLKRDTMRPVGVVSKKLNGARKMRPSRESCMRVDARTPNTTTINVRMNENVAVPIPAIAYSICKECQAHNDDDSNNQAQPNNTALWGCVRARRVSFSPL